MNSSAPDHLFTAKQLISTFFRESERELSRLAQHFSLGAERCSVSDVTEVIEFPLS